MRCGAIDLLDVTAVNKDGVRVISIGTNRRTDLFEIGVLMPGVAGSVFHPQREKTTLREMPEESVVFDWDPAWC